MSSDSCFVASNLYFISFNGLSVYVSVFFYSISKIHIHKQGQNEERCVKRINNCKITIVICYHRCSHWTWKREQRRHLISHTSKIVTQLQTFTFDHMVLSHWSLCVLFWGVIGRSQRKTSEEAKLSCPYCSDRALEQRGLLCPWATPIPFKGASKCLMEVVKDLWRVLILCSTP